MALLLSGDPRLDPIVLKHIDHPKLGKGVRALLRANRFLASDLPDDCFTEDSMPIDGKIAEWEKESDSKYEEAIRVLEECVSTCPESSDGCAILGHLYSFVGRHQDAIDVYSRICDENPGNLAYHYLLAKSLTESLRSFYSAFGGGYMGQRSDRHWAKIARCFNRAKKAIDLRRFSVEDAFMLEPKDVKAAAASGLLIKIWDRDFVVVPYEGEDTEILRRAARLVNRRMWRQARSYHVVGTFEVAIITAMNLAIELLTLKKEKAKRPSSSPQ